MTDVCRFCLRYSTENMIFLSELDESWNILKCLSINVSLNDVLPNQICLMCKSKLTEINEFHTQVQKNQQILLNRLNLGIECLNNFYDQIKTGIKKETDKPTVPCASENADSLIKGNKTVLQELKLEDELDMNEVEHESENDDLFLSEIKDIIKDCKPEIDEANEDLKLKCLTCFAMFKTPSALIKHYKNDHRSKKKLKISISEVLENETKLYKCDKCSKMYDSRRKVYKHFEVHSDERFHCKLCGRTYKNVSEIVRHSRAHDGPRVFCSAPGCRFTTVYSGALKYHENLKHKKNFKYKCETCGKGFQVKTWYEQHQNIHKGLRPFVCHVCGMSFHMDRYLTTHRTSKHPNTSPHGRYECTHCSKPCGTMKALRAHLKEHGITSSFLCDLCGKTLGTADQLKTHREIHSGIKPFACTTCDRRFSKKANLKLHQVTHTGERPHVCECGKGYSQRSALLRHIAKQHNGNAKSGLKSEKSLTLQDAIEHNEKVSS